MLCVDQIDTFYGDSHVLRNVSFSVETGSSVALLGRNGMGKTTLIKTLMGFLRPAVGTISFEGSPIHILPPERISRLGFGYVPEGRGIFPNLSVIENLLVSARPSQTGSRGWDLARVISTFPRLKERLSHGGQQLSGGEQQMLAIGRALMTNPKLLILDEATEGLAPLIVAEIWRVIAQIRQTGISTIVVDRDWRQVLSNTDVALVLEKGCVIRLEKSAPLLQDAKFLHEALGV
jgi:branched-chain amino acid transport system ATP-binding protein